MISLQPHPQPGRPYHAYLLICAVLLFYTPFWFTFVGTDLGVYYEIGRRLAEDGRLVLWGNYWDHKPPLVYAFFAPFTLLDAWLGESHGVKIAGYAGYLGLAWLLYHTTLSGIRRRGAEALVFTGALLFIAIVLGWLDWGLNGFPMIAALVFSYGGLVLAIHGTRKSVAAAGLLLGLAPFIRPTALSYLPVLMLLVAMKLRQDRDYAWLARLATGGFIALACCLLLLSASNPVALFDTLVNFNAYYGSHKRDLISIREFLLQDRAAFMMALLLMSSAIGIALLRARDNRPHAWLVIAWGGVEWLSILYQRTNMPYYKYGFLLPSLFVFLYVASGHAQRLRRIAVVGLLLLWVVACRLDIKGLDMRIFQNRFITQQEQQTYAIARVVAGNRCTAAAPSVLVYGNRAQIYTLGAALGVQPYRWPVYMNPLVDEGYFAQAGMRFVGALRAAPPDYIAYVGQDGWTPNIGGRMLALEAYIAEAYRQIELPRARGSESPYGYHYRLYRHMRCQAPTEGASPVGSGHL